MGTETNHSVRCIERFASKRAWKGEFCFRDAVENTKTGKRRQTPSGRLPQGDYEKVKPSIKSSARPPVVVNKKISPRVTNSSTRLVPVRVRRVGHEGFFYVPVCDVCQKPILNFEEANVVVKGWKPSAESRPAESLGSVDGTEFFRVPGVAVAVHFECDRHEWKPWVRLSSVFGRDQRHPLEKMGWTGVGA
jgi:hypothetical protein